MTPQRPSPCTRRWFNRLALLGLLGPATAVAAVLAEPDASAIKRLIESQLEAFAADDSERAFSYATPNIRAQFGQAGVFMSMVKGAYPMLVRPSAVTFLLAETKGEAGKSPAAPEQVVQVVLVRDREGSLWKATYLMVRQAEAGWRIGGCVVVADGGKSSA